MKFKNNKIKLKKERVIEYIRKNKHCTNKDIKRYTKVKLERIGWDMKMAYLAAGVEFSKNLTKRNKENQKQEVINFIRHNPTCTISEIHKQIQVNVIRTFGSIVNAYNAADIDYPKKQVTSGVMNPLVIERCIKFEKKIFRLLSHLGKVESKIRINNGIIDCLFTYKEDKYVVEIKDYRGKNNITMYELKQLIRYMNCMNHKKGILICPRSSLPKRKNSRIIHKENFVIYILSEEDIQNFILFKKWGCWDSNPDPLV